MLQADMQQVDVANLRSEGAYERYGWIDPVGECDTRHLRRLDDDLATNLLVMDPHLRERLFDHRSPEPHVGFNILALVMTLTPKQEV
jgi:hypothetical protein